MEYGFIKANTKSVAGSTFSCTQTHTVCHMLSAVRTFSSARRAKSFNHFLGETSMDYTVGFFSFALCNVKCILYTDVVVACRRFFSTFLLGCRPGCNCHRSGGVSEFGMVVFVRENIIRKSTAPPSLNLSRTTLFVICCHGRFTRSWQALKSAPEAMPPK